MKYKLGQSNFFYSMVNCFASMKLINVTGLAVTINQIILSEEIMYLDNHAVSNYPKSFIYKYICISRKFLLLYIYFFNTYVFLLIVQKIE